jgi:hypothetical protein
LTMHFKDKLAIGAFPQIPERATDWRQDSKVYLLLQICNSPVY